MANEANYFRNGDAVRDERVFSKNWKTVDDDETKDRRVDVCFRDRDHTDPSIHDSQNRPRNRRRHQRSIGKQSSQGSTSFSIGVSEISQASLMDPSERVQFILNEEDTDGVSLETHSLFTEMVELVACDDGKEWRETARWVKFEEDVEEGGNRWSKPHVASLSLHSLFELRSCLTLGTVLLDVDSSDWAQVVDILLTSSTSLHQLTDEQCECIRDALLRRRKHQYEQEKSDLIKSVRSFADIGRTFSQAKNLPVSAEFSASHQSKTTLKSSTFLSVSPSVPKVPSAKDIAREGSFSDTGSAGKGNQHFFKKLPHGAEASNVFVGELDILQKPISAFIRLKSASNLSDLTEVPLPTRFLFVVVGPTGRGKQYREIGRALATLMSDEIFHNIAYKARTRIDLLAGVDEFLDQVTVLPPGEWDPNIRIEPPQTIPSQEKRKQAPSKAESTVTFEVPKPNELLALIEPVEGHGLDPTLKRTGRLFGGLINDIKRKRPFYLSDFKDCLNLQCLASFMFMYFAMLAPIVTFGGLLEEATDKRMGAIENLLSGAICGTIYSLFAGQPLTMIGSTGPVLVFEKIIFDMCENKMDFLSFRLWINLWSGIILMIIVATDASAAVSYITRFTEENFAVLISFIFIYESFAKTYKILSTAHTVAFHKDLPLNPKCSCIPLMQNNLTSLNKTFVDYSPVLDKFVKDRWKGNVSTWTHFDNETSTVSVDWDNIPLTYCTASNGLLTTTDPSQCYRMYDVFLMSVILTLGTFLFAYILKAARNSGYFPSKVREIVSDFAVIISLTSMVLLDYFVALDTPKLYVPKDFRPTWSGRTWVIDPFNGNQWWSCILAIPPALLLCILLFMDHHITIVIVNRKENKLKKGCGYHLDLFWLAIGVVICGILGLPIFVAATVMAVTHVNSLRVESECRAPGEKPAFIGVREQRVTGFLVYAFIGVSVFLTDLLKLIPMPVLYGVFLYMGISSLRGVQMIDRLCLLFMPMKYQPDYAYLRHVPVKRVHLFTVFQLGCFVILCVIKEIHITSIVFPIMLVGTVAVRKVMEYVFTDSELRYLDDKMPEFTLRKREDAKMSMHPANHPQNKPRRLSAVQTDTNLHIQLTSGDVVKIPLVAIAEKSKDSLKAMNITHELNKSGIWQHIESLSSFGSKAENRDNERFSSWKTSIPAKSVFSRATALGGGNEEEDIPCITIQQPTPNVSHVDLEKLNEIHTAI